MTISEAIEMAAPGYKISGVVVDGCVVGTELVNAAGDLIGFWAVGQKESGPPPVSALDKANRQFSHVSSAE